MIATPMLPFLVDSAPYLYNHAVEDSPAKPEKGLRHHELSFLGWER
jgi:hypothetical protein